MLEIELSLILDTNTTLKNNIYIYLYNHSSYLETQLNCLLTPLFVSCYVLVQSIQSICVSLLCIIDW